VTDVDFDDAGVTVTGHTGETYRARYVVDASGHQSPVAAKFAVREDPCRFSHHSRSMWTHMIDVPRTDALFQHAPADRPPVLWYEGTVHHTFDRGWFWVIPFNNHPSSQNPLCSVGLTLDERRYPVREDLSPAEEFALHAARFPDVARQFEGATSVREWTRTGRLQYSSKTCVGDRWCLLSHAAGFIDPLFSRGLSNTAEAINALAWRLLRAFRDDDFSAERFEYVNRLQQGLFDYNDKVVNAAFIAFDDYDLWTAVFRIWAWGSNAGTFHLQQGLTAFLKDGDDQHFIDLEESPNLGSYWPDHAGYAALFDDMVAQCAAYEAGTITARQAADALYQHLESANFVPKHFGFAERGQRFLHPTPKVLAKTVRWALTDASPEVRHLMLGTGGQAIKAKLRGRRIF
jgi:tetracycline 7-halogenase / FADH2 O2-dependent halogenase